MGAREKLSESLRKDGIKDRSGIWHSKAYHRFFEGYAEFSVPSADGKRSHIERLYTGNYYRAELTTVRYVLIRILYFVLFLTAACLFISGATQPLAGNTTWYVVLFQVAAIPFLFWMLLALLAYLTAPRKMTIAEYRASSPSLIKASLASAAALALVALVTGAFPLFSTLPNTWAEMVNAVRYLGAGGVAFVVNLLEKNIHYELIPSELKPPADSFEIK